MLVDLKIKKWALPAGGLAVLATFQRKQVRESSFLDAVPRREVVDVGPAFSVHHQISAEEMRLARVPLEGQVVAKMLRTLFNELGSTLIKEMGS